MSKILKRPGTTILYLFMIMLLLIVRDSDGHDKCYRPCFGPVWKVKFYNELSKGYLHVEGNTVVANFTDDGTLYKISKGANFYLYDANAAKFICWSNLKNTKKAKLVARKYKSHPMRLCEFRDMVSDDDFRNSHIHLLSSHRDLKMKFNRNGRFSMKKCINQSVRHKHRRCVTAADFLVVPFGSNDINDSCGCPEAVSHFCQSQLKSMTELQEICSLSRTRSNETYEI